jgi:hypothetical protein
MTYEASHPYQTVEAWAISTSTTTSNTASCTRAYRRHGLPSNLEVVQTAIHASRLSGGTAETLSIATITFCAAYTGSMLFEEERPRCRCHWQQRTDVFPQDMSAEYAKYPMVTADQLRGRRERPRRVKMLTRDFIEGLNPPSLPLLYIN